MSANSGHGMMSSIRRIAGSVLGLVHTRLELFAVELQEEKLRVGGLLVWLAIAVAIGIGGILVAIGTLAFYLWERAGYLGLIALAGASLLVAVLLLWVLYRRVMNGPGPFAATVAEFEKDLECLRPE